jgi:hypothetical protein
MEKRNLKKNEKEIKTANFYQRKHIAVREKFRGENFFKRRVLS